jgi:hypothetical protein
MVLIIGFFTDEEWNERLTILEESHKLRQLAEFFLHPEKPVAMDATACARCYFDRPSAPEQTTSPQEEEEAARILADAQALKKVAADYLMPELPVNADSTLYGRNYFDRGPSAEEQETLGEAEERARILQDAKQLKKLAVDYLHPEKHVESTDYFACGRNYFTRPSAEDYEEVVDSDERELIMKDLKQLKQLAVNYLHPEKPVVTSDPYITGRDYFSRPSAEEYESEDDMDDRDDIMEDMKQLKKLAQDYLQPERSVEVDPLASCRNYFSRASAPDQESIEEERIQILADARQLKQLAVDYLHPEKPVVTSDAFAFGRNYFTRPSAEDDDEEDAEERELILEEMQQLKKLAQDYLQPERPVVTSDPYAMGRNYFSRPSAEHQEDLEERDMIMEDMKQLKNLAQDYLQPERSVEVDPLVSCRNYFSRPSAPNQESIEEEEERAQILADAHQLKQLAVDYLHPEKPVITSDAFAFGRNYFTRPSAADDDDEAEERELILEEMQQLKKLAQDYLQPEIPVVTTDMYGMGRNYFSRPSAEHEEDLEERDMIMEDMKQLQKLAVDYLHPEKPVVTSDPSTTGRSYFSRPSAEHEEDLEERDMIMEDMKQLQKLAVDYLHPEKPVVTSDPSTTGRSYFSRPSAEHEEDLEERDMIMEDMKQLQKLAVDYLHPEKPVVTSDPSTTGRSYFSRPSAEHEEDLEERDMIMEDMKQLKKLAQDYLQPERSVELDPLASCRNFFSRPSAPNQESIEEERIQILADARQLKQLAVDYLHPEKPVVTSDAFAFGRNYFTRPSADDEEDAEEREVILEEMQQLKQLAVAYLHPERPVVTSDPYAMGRNYFSRPSAEQYVDEDEMDERDSILEDMQQLKKLATDYLHPEAPIKMDASGVAMGRNYFLRPSAPEQASLEEAEEKERILEDAKQLKKLAVDYLHPETPMVRTSITVGRNFFSRPSAPGHAEQIHTQGEAIEPGYEAHAYHDIHHHYAHHDDDAHSHYSYQSDHFEMDEDMFHEFHESMAAMATPSQTKIIKEMDEEEEGNLSRSPSSVMLCFTGEAV